MYESSTTSIYNINKLIPTRENLCYTCPAMTPPFPYRVGEPPARLKKARLDNIALVPASLLPLKGTYQNVANSYPTGSVLCVPGTLKQQKIVATITQFFRDHGRQVITMSLEKITRTMKKAPRTQAENLPLAF
jgi:hypothetical protein